MGSKQCAKCGEVVDEAKAFCPGCGNAFVEEEKRTTVSDFDMSNETVRLGNSMYNQLLSDMGLSISKAPNKGEAADAEPKAPEPAVQPPVRSADVSFTRKKWLIRATFAVLGLLFVLALVLLVILFLLWQRFA